MRIISGKFQKTLPFYKEKVWLYFFLSFRSAWKCINMIKESIAKTWQVYFSAHFTFIKESMSEKVNLCNRLLALSIRARKMQLRRYVLMLYTIYLYHLYQFGATRQISISPPKICKIGAGPYLHQNLQLSKTFETIIVCKD